MTSKTFIPEDDKAPRSQIGASFDTLYKTLESRRFAGDESYTHRLLEGDLDKLLKKVSEEALESALAAKETQMLDAYSDSNEMIDGSVDHLRYEAADVIYHVLVLLVRFGVSADELAAELNARMKPEELHDGAIQLHKEHIRRGH